MTTIRARRRDQRGITTAEYAVGTAAGAGLAGLLYKLLSGGFGDQLLKTLFDHVLVAAGHRVTRRPRRGPAAQRGAVTAELRDGAAPAARRHRRPGLAARAGRRPRCGCSTRPARRPAPWPAATPRTPALDRARQVAPPGAALSIGGDDDRVVVTGSVEVDGVGGLFDVLPSVTVSAAATAAREEPP